MAPPHAHPFEKPPPDGDTCAIGDVVDRRLWALAAAVAAAHRAGTDGRCTNLLCHGQPAPCEPARSAHAAAQLARRPPASPLPLPPTDDHPARGRAAVPYGPSGFAGLLDPPERTTTADAATDRRVFTPFRRPDAAATRQQHQEEERS
ncbi:hypothetical protein [Actinoplanes sp. G11-F43]|uniref:hypothetical protein n=1 Tax=Actinoplanes sp. G11-F43 TaxID=3424130 RepID=UPI003D3340DA